ncbi:MAG TPA: phenylalanine--tRNA ligase subunit beta [Candidatus Humimicrobiaceae bacterium]
MKVTLNWICEFLDTDTLEPESIVNALTMSGTEVKKIEYVGGRYKNIIVGKIIDYSDHPDAGKLSLCKVDIGSKKLDIVCGARNFKKEDKVAVALPGARIKDVTIKKSKIRGQISEGMMCSEMELGLSSESQGIMILDESCKIGEDFSKSVGLDDTVLELEITPNRPDCLSVIGIAREISTLTDKKLIIPNYDINKKLNLDSKFVIEINDYTLCPRYSAKIFRNTPDIESPRWIKNRLMLCDVRPVNLIVDLTNYIMLETGQPMHAFDKDLLYSGKIIVRNAAKKEKIKMIDDSIKILDEDALVIADEKKVVAIAGIMGGKDTEINPDTKNVLLESANFYGPSIMKTSKNIGLRTEASNRFEKKIDPMLTVFAIERFEDMLKKVTGIETEEFIHDNYMEKDRKRKIDLRVEKVSKILGKQINKELISKILTKLKINNIVKDNIVQVTVPSFRYEDLEREIDLIEEIARIYGYDKLDSIPTGVKERRGKYSFYQKTVRNIRQILCDIGLDEVINYSFLSAVEIETFKLNLEEEYKDSVAILNPINEDFKFLRPMLLPSLMKNIKDNINHTIKDIRIFEISKVFKKKNTNNLPLEINMLGIILTGNAVQKGWDEKERPFDFYDLKGILENLCIKYYPGNGPGIEEKGYKFFHPGISGNIKINGINMGIIGMIHPLIIEETETGQNVYYMEINMDNFINNIKETRDYKPIPAFPSIDIDLAIVVDDKIKSEDITDEIKKSGTELLKKVRLFDIYRGEQIEKNKKSIAYSLNFRDDSRTLKDTEIEIIVNRILENLGKRFNAKIRE